MQLSSFLRTVIRCCVGASSLCIAQLSAQNNLASQVTIYRDTYGIPHVFGETDAATMFGFAYAQAEDNFRRPHELAPIVRAAWQPAEHVFGADNSQREGSRGPVQSGADEGAPRLDQYSDASKENGRIDDMLDDLECQYDIESLVGIGDRLSGSDSIIDRETRRLDVRPRHGDCLRIRVDPGHGKSEASHRLGDQTSAAADIEQAEAFKRLQRGSIATEMLH